MAEYDLSKLAPEARSRVESAMKRTIEAELAGAATGIGAGEMMAHSRSKSFFFSRSKTSDSLMDRVTNPAEIDRALLRNVESLDEASFSRFAERLSTLRKVRASSGK